MYLPTILWSITFRCLPFIRLVKKVEKHMKKIWCRIVYSLLLIRDFVALTFHHLFSLSITQNLMASLNKHSNSKNDSSNSKGAYLNPLFLFLYQTQTWHTFYVNLRKLYVLFTIHFAHVYIAFFLWELIFFLIKLPFKDLHLQQKDVSQPIGHFLFFDNV